MGIYYGKADFITYGKPSLFLDFANKKYLTDRISGNNLITFTRTSSGTYVGSDGSIKTASADEPRFDHDPVTGESLGLLIEESSTNEWSNSESLVGGTNGYTLPGGLTNPAGGSTAVKIPSGSRQTWWNRGTGGFAVTSGDYWTMSWWAYSTNQSVDFGNSDYFYVANTTISQDKTVSAGQWKKCYRTVQFTASGSPQIRFMPYNYTLYTDTNNEVFVWGFQFEKKAFPTSYIPTSGSTVTRTADNASITGANFSSWYNQNEGTILTSHLAPYNPITDGRSIWQIDRPSATGGWEHGFIYERRSNKSYGVRGGSTDGSYTSYITTDNPGDRTISAFTWNNTDNYTRIVVNGNLGSVVSKGGGTNMDIMRIGYASAFGGYTSATNQPISKIVYYPFRLTDTQLQSLTR